MIGIKVIRRGETNPQTGATITPDKKIYSWASTDIHADGEFWEGRLESASASDSHVDRWVPMSSRLSRMTFTLRDQDGKLAKDFSSDADNAEKSLVGRNAELWSIGTGEPRKIASAVVRYWSSSAGKISLTLEDPALLNFGVPLGPKLIDVDSDADDRYAGNLVPQVYGRSTRIPFAGGRVINNSITLVACVGDRPVNTVYYDGSIIPDAQWVREVSGEVGDRNTTTLVRVTGDTSRRIRDFEWSGGQEGYTVSGMISDVLRFNGVSQDKINVISFLNFDSILSSRGLFDNSSPEGSIVVSDYSETLSTVIEKIQQTWAVLLYLDVEGRFSLRFPAISGSDEIKTISPSEIFSHRWSINTPEGASHWDVDYEREWAAGNYSRHREIILDANADAFGSISSPIQMEGRAIALHYARGHSADGLARDRIVNERWNRFRAKISVDSNIDVRTGDFISIDTDNSIGSLPEYLKNKSFFVDGFSLNGNGMNIQSELTLSPLLGDDEGVAQPITANIQGFEYPTGFTSYQTGQKVNEPLNRLFNGHGRNMLFSILSAPFWLYIETHDDNGVPLSGGPRLCGEAIWPSNGGDPIHTYTGIKIRAVDDEYGFAAVKTLSLDVSKPDSQVDGVPTLRLTDITENSAIVRWESVIRSIAYDVEVDGETVSGDDGQYATSYPLSFTRRATAAIRVSGRNQVGRGGYSSKTFLFIETPTAPTLSIVGDKLLKVDGVVGNRISVSWPDYTSPIPADDFKGWEYQYDFSQSFLNPVTRYSYAEGSRLAADFAGTGESNLFVPHDGRRRALYVRVRSVANEGGASPWSQISTIYIGLQYSDFDGLMKGANTGFGLNPQNFDSTYDSLLNYNNNNFIVIRKSGLVGVLNMGNDPNTRFRLARYRTFRNNVAGLFDTRIPGYWSSNTTEQRPGIVIIPEYWSKRGAIHLIP